MKRYFIPVIILINYFKSYIIDNTIINGSEYKVNEIHNLLGDLGFTNKLMIVYLNLFL